MISRQSEQIEDLKAQIIKLNLEIEEKNHVINSVASLREELTQNVAEAKKCKQQIKKLVSELKKMKEIINQTVYKGRWRIIKFLLK